jgi:hypothetical protein
MVKKRVASKVARMVGGSSCPPGVWCMDTGTLIVCLLLVGILGFMAYQVWSKPTPVQKPTVVVVPQRTTAVPVNVSIEKTDPRFSPLAPERSFETPPDLRGSPPLPPGIGVPINQMTRGVPEQFQQIGVLTAPGGSETSATPTRTILPLFGRKAVTNRDRWNYYTRTDGMNPVQVPVEFQRRKCDDDTGCQEITEGDAVAVPILGQSFIASVYRYSTPRYIPQL